MSSLVEIIGRLGGSLLIVVFNLAVLVLLVLWQRYEYRHQWAHGFRRYVVMKASLVASLVVLGLAALMSTRLVVGMEGLAVFYAGLLVAIITAPLLSAAVGRGLGIPLRDSVQVTGSLIVALLTGWFLAASLFNQLASIAGFDYQAQKAYLDEKYAAEHAAPAGDRIVLADRGMYRLPDASRLIWLAFRVAPGYQVRSLEVSMARTNNPRQDKFFSGMESVCYTGGTVHLLTVLDRNEELDVRMRFGQGTPTTVIEYQGRFDFPDTPEAQTGYLEATVKDNALSFPLPLPARSIILSKENKRIPATTFLAPADDAGLANTAATMRCITDPISPIDGVDHVEVYLVSDERNARKDYYLRLVERGS